MRENEFEKQVQQKMGELDLDPSAEVWAAVERRIRKEKKRRFIFWWLPLLFLLLGGGIATVNWFNNKKENNTNAIVTKELDSESQPASLENDPVSKPSIAIGENKNEEDETDVDKKGIEKSVGSKRIVESPGEKKEFTDSPYSLKNKYSKALPVQRMKKNSETILDKDMSSANNTRLNDRAPDLLIEKSDNKIVNNNEQVVADVMSESENSENEIEKSDQEEKIQASDSIDNKSTEKVTNNKLKKWDLGITVSAGKSSLSNGLSLFNKSIYADELSSQYSSPGGAGGGLNNQSLIRPSFSWSAGAYIKRSLSKKLDLNLGLGYSYLSTKFNIGSRVDSNRNISNLNTGSVRVENFYRPSGSGNSSVYTNRYHFISLSATISWQIFQAKKLKLYWENGLSYERLLGSSMLHFDNILPGYYKDNNQLRKSHIVLSTGFSIPVSQRVMINPFASYNLTPVLGNSSFTKANFNNLGIRMKLLLKKKN